MIPETVLKEILALAVYAPSGDNSQPWEFAIGPDSISLFNLPERDETLYNFHQHGSYLAHGAVAENISIISAQMGYKATIQPFPGENNCTARITLVHAKPTQDILYSAIKKRATNRKPYKIESLQPQHLSAIQKSIASFGSVSLLLAQDRNKIAGIAQAVSANERLLMENRSLHDFLFSMIRWTKKEESQKPGLLVDTMEFPSPVRFLFRYVLCRWWLLRFMNFFGFSRMLPKQTASLYRACSAIGAIVIAASTDAEFFNAGRALQRLWLTVTNMGLSLQPITALPYLTRRVHAGEAGAFSEQQVNLILQKHTQIAQMFGLASDGHIAMLFRLGYGPIPSAYSAKLAPVIRRP